MDDQTDWDTHTHIQQNYIAATISRSLRACSTRKLFVSFFLITKVHTIIYTISDLTFSETTNFRLFQTQRVCRQKWQKILQMGRNYCWKRRNCSFRAISFFPKVFSKDLYCRHVKTKACFGKGKTQSKDLTPSEKGLWKNITERG